ncbi:MAG: chemotaxis protein CheW [Sinobacterium sp.]|nr:chemotaxis protein CheW [Sinobacterium sp.]
MAEQTSDTKKLPTLLFNIEGSQVLLPDIAIAEIIEYQVISNVESDDIPDWWLGQLTWRGLQVPLISLESMNHGAFFTKKPALKIIVVNALNALKDKGGYWAFVALDTPKLQRIQSDSLVASDDATVGDVTLMQAELEGEEVLILDMAKIESEIERLL